MEWIYIAIGAALGAVSRFYVGQQIEMFAYATFTVNMVGSFSLGIVSQIVSVHREKKWLKFGVGIGFLGSFTTFSTFMVDFYRLIDKDVFIAFTYIFLTLLFGLLFAYVGIAITKKALKLGDES